jgi:hypothetical protein
MAALLFSPPLKVSAGRLADARAWLISARTWTAAAPDWVALGWALADAAGFGVAWLARAEGDAVGDGVCDGRGERAGVWYAVGGTWATAIWIGLLTAHAPATDEPHATAVCAGLCAPATGARVAGLEPPYR